MNHVRSVGPAVVMAALLTISASGCGSSDETARPTRTTGRPELSTPTSVLTPSTTTRITVAESSVPESTEPQTVSAAPPPVTALPTDQRGTVFALVRSFDPASRTVVIDVAQYLGDDDLIDHYASNPADWTELYCISTNSYYDGTQSLSECDLTGASQLVINESSKLRTLSVHRSATFEVPEMTTGAGVPATSEGFAAYLASGAQLGTAYWLEIDDGWVRSFRFNFFS